MSNKDLCKGKHLKIDDRLIIKYGLEQNYILKEIADRVKMDPATISKEIKRNRFIKSSKKKEMTCNHANTKRAILRQIYVIIDKISNVKNVILLIVIGYVLIILNKYYHLF